MPFCKSAGLGKAEKLYFGFPGAINILYSFISKTKPFYHYSIFEVQTI